MFWDYAVPILVVLGFVVLWAWLLPRLGMRT